jgi:hypothetical protein
MGIIHGNIFEHSLRVCHFVAFNNLGSTTLRFCNIGRARLSDHLYFYGYIYSSFVFVAAYFQLDCFEAVKIGTWDATNQDCRNIFYRDEGDLGDVLENG